MTELERKIIWVANSVPKTYGEYRIIKELFIGIAKVMGYKTFTVVGGYTHISNPDDHKKVVKIIDGMEKRGIIKLSKSKMAYRVL